MPIGIKTIEGFVMKSVIKYTFVVSLLLSCSISYSDGLYGAMGGIGNALSTIGAQQAEQEAEKERIRYENQLEAEREQRAYERNLANRRVEAAQQRKNKEDADAQYLEKQTQILSLYYPDWKAIASSDDFAKWRNTLPPETNDTLLKTRDSEFLIKAFSAFKEWQVKQSSQIVAKVARQTKKHSKQN